MFDINRIAEILKNARVKTNLTQSALAEQIGVTYQAVSNWERGSALPDISNLSNLCSIIDINPYELLGMKSDNLAEAVLSGAWDLEKATIREIASVAPMIPPEQVMSAIRKKGNGVEDMAIMAEIAPFVDDGFLEEIGQSMTPSRVGEILAMAPFVSEELCAAWIDKVEDFSDFDLDVGTLSALAPFLSEEQMDKLSKFVVPDELTVISAVAPRSYLSKHLKISFCA